MKSREHIHLDIYCISRGYLTFPQKTTHGIWILFARNSFLDLTLKYKKRAFEIIFKNKVMGAKKLSILLHFYVSLCGYITFPQKQFETFIFWFD